MVTVSYMHKTRGRFGDRKAFNVVIKTPRTVDGAEVAYEGLCAEKKSTKAAWGVHKAATSSLFTGSTKCTAGANTIVQPNKLVLEENDLVTVIPSALR